MLLRNRLALALVSFVALMSVSAPARADSGVIAGARLGYYANADAPFAGGELLLKIASSVYFNPNFEVVFKEDTDLSFNADFHYDFPHHGNTLLWAGAGLGFVAVNPPGPADGHTDAALNLLFGVGLLRRPVIPYFQVKVVAKDDSDLSLAIGLRF